MKAINYSRVFAAIIFCFILVICHNGYAQTVDLTLLKPEIKYQTEKKDQEPKLKKSKVSTLEKQMQEINLKLQKVTRQVIIVGAVLFVILFGLGYHIYRSKQRFRQQLKLQQAVINTKNRSLLTLIKEKDGLLIEKEWLMKEIHHRVKNNLQIMISLLNTQLAYLDNDAAYNAVKESQQRMQSISLVHQKLYQSENLALVNLQAYVNDLIGYLSDSFDSTSRITFETDVAAIELDVTTSVPIGLILNEAITNAIKYAFPQNAHGTISISLQLLTTGMYELKIHDNGIKDVAVADITGSKTLGMNLMKGLSKQLNGKLTVENNEGITITLKFADYKLLKAV
ncbi:Two-component sensor histidine kinase, contains HisKA and HATPase domains [Mucilaginibacter pineti]|uniref:histidine kinase n=1 Tax=Mucilaginibacter pineti TaxID=1391627 RepID=A0A1G6ZKX2_9SPHI|nr:histidine kinase dimerization/phosphoacceptor domain -containing protein [Mucilaginibacter pineti]SDE02206.1 Two-component sensor histidine kinase, contains HisKA and HATPase domains [Mucilaginibacter pineti]